MKTLVGVVGKGPERIAELVVGEEDEPALLQEYVFEVTLFSNSSKRLKEKCDTGKMINIFKFRTYIFK